MINFRLSHFIQHYTIHTATHRFLWHGIFIKIHLYITISLFIMIILLLLFLFSLFCAVYETLFAWKLKIIDYILSNALIFLYFVFVENINKQGTIEKSAVQTLYVLVLCNLKITLKFRIKQLKLSIFCCCCRGVKLLNIFFIVKIRIETHTHAHIHPR